MALEGCIGDKHLPTAIAIARWKLFESGLAGDDLFAELDKLWKVKHGHDVSPVTPKRRIKHSSLAPNEKWCNGCERARLRVQFSVDRSRKDGLNNRCRDCASGYFKKQQSRRCRKCNGYAIGTTCARCYRLAIALRDFDHIGLIIPRMLLEWRKAHLSIEAIKVYNKAADLLEQSRLKARLNL